MSEAAQSSFEGWAVVEMMGHRKEIGFVTTQAFGQAVLFRVDTPELQEREFELTRPEYVEATWMASGTKVKRAAAPARSCLVAPSSLYALNPCSEEAAREAIERAFPRPLILVERPPQRAIAAQEEEEEDDLPEFPAVPRGCSACAVAPGGTCEDCMPF